jgi:dTDP-4-amino-4,6-dideoxygalactose transaminase
MSDIHASLGISQLKKINVFLKYRNKIANIYDKELTHPLIFLPKKDKDYFSTYHLYIIKLKLKKINKSYDFIFKKIQSKGIGINLHYLPVHLHPLFRKMGFKSGDFPCSEKYSNCAISIPIYFGLKNKDQQKVIKIIKNVLR